jgi:hypothetical protein
MGITMGTPRMPRQGHGAGGGRQSEWRNPWREITVRLLFLAVAVLLALVWGESQESGSTAPPGEPREALPAAVR